MIRFGLVLFAGILLGACSHSSKKDLVVFRATAEGLDQSNTMIQQASDEIYESFEEKKKMPGMEPLVDKWQQNAKKIKQLSRDMIAYIILLEQLLIEEAGGKEVYDIYEKDDEGPSNRLFDKAGKGKELYDRLKLYLENVLQISPDLNQALKDRVIIIDKDFDKKQFGQKEFLDQYFSDQPTIAGIAMLDRLDNNVRIIENQCSKFCYNEVGVLDGPGSYDHFSSIIAQSSSIVLPGENIQITAGIGSFSRAAEPMIIIDGRTAKTDDNGIVTQKVKASTVPGKHIIKVKIEFFKPDGTKGIDEKEIPYTVGLPQTLPSH